MTTVFKVYAAMKTFAGSITETLIAYMRYLRGSLSGPPQNADEIKSVQMYNEFIKLHDKEINTRIYFKLGIDGVYEETKVRIKVIKPFYDADIGFSHLECMIDHFDERVSIKIYLNDNKLCTFIDAVVARNRGWVTGERLPFGYDLIFVD